MREVFAFVNARGDDSYAAGDCVSMCVCVCVCVCVVCASMLLAVQGDEEEEKKFFQNRTRARGES